MENPLRIVLGMMGSLAVALALVLGCANALHAWHDVGQHSPAASLLESEPIGARTEIPTSSYWSGRL